MIIEEKYIDNDQLRISEYLDNPYQNIGNIDFTIVGLDKQPPVFDTDGRKMHAEYANDDGDVVVKKTFSDISDGISILFEWLKEDGTIGTSKTKVVHMSAVEWTEHLQKRADRAVIINS